MPRGKEETFHPTKPGKTLVEQLWDEMDVVMDRLMADYAETTVEEFYRKDGTTDGEGILRWGEERGNAQGLAFALALFTTNSYEPNVDAIREQAYERWELRNAAHDKPEKKAKMRHRDNVVQVLSVGPTYAHVRVDGERTTYNALRSELEEL